MLPSRFEYHRPDSLEEALQLLAEHGDEAKVLAGGQSLIPVMKLRLAAPAHLIDISRLGMDSIAEADGHLAIGALARHRDLERSDLLKARYPVMAAAAPLISDPIVRNLGTIGGSLCHADPAGDWGSVMLALAGVGGAPERARRTRAADRRVPRGHVHDGARARRDPDRGPGPAAGRLVRRHLPEDGAQGRRLRDGRRGRPPLAVGRHDRARGHRPHRRRPRRTCRRRTRRRASPAPSRPRRRSPRPDVWRPRPPRRSPTCAVPPTTSATSSTCTCDEGSPRALEMARAA